VLATFALAQLLGDCYAICTATVKHHSAMILERLGATPLRYLSDELPGYYDPHYRSEMRLLFFDSRQPHSRFSGMVADIEAMFRQGPGNSKLSPDAEGFHLLDGQGTPG
jgi:hypothetical protein